MQITKVSDIAVIHLAGDLDFKVLAYMEKKLLNIVKSGISKIILDMTLVEHFHYLEVFRFSQIARELRKYKGDLKLVGLNHNTDNIVKFTGGQQIFHCLSTVAEGILSFYNPTTEEAFLYQ